MMFDAIQVAAGLLLAFFLPGYTLVNLIFPRRGELDPEYDQVYRITLGMGLSVVITIFVGFVLNALSSSEAGYVRAGPLWLVLTSLTGLFLLAGWLRGAYPRAGFVHPSLYRPVPEHRSDLPARKEFQKKRSLDKLILERKVLIDDLKKFADRSSGPNPQRQLYYRKRMETARKRVDAINDEITKLESGGK